jgi:hypothetical protein
MSSPPDPATVRDLNIDLMNRYADALDRRDWEAFAGLFTEDASFVAQYVTPGEPVEPLLSLGSRNTIVGVIGPIIEGLSATHHMMSNHVVEPARDGRRARTSCYFRAHHHGAGERSHLFDESLGRFDFETVLSPAGWQIRRMVEHIMVKLGDPGAFAPRP